MNNTNSLKGELQIVINHDNEWKRHKIENGYILYKGNFLSWGIKLDNLVQVLGRSNDDIVKYINNIRGNFSFIINSGSHKIISVDHIRSIPLYYLSRHGITIVTDDVDYLKKQLDSELSISKSSKLQILMSGYALFEDTIFKNVRSFIPGEVFLYFCKNISIYNINNYKSWFSKKDNDTESLNSLCSKFNNIILGVMHETISSLNNRQVIIPLTSGYDSRLIASIFRHYNYENVICYTYGTKNNFEALSAKKFSESLGYKWTFVELKIKEQISFYKSNDFSSYLDYANTIDSVPYYQGLYSVKYLKEKKIIEDNAIFINGNSGDFITGGHISKFYQHCNNTILSSSITDIIIDNYYSLWGHEKTLRNIDIITKKIEDKYNHIKGFYNTDINICDFVYYYEFINRQSKYVIQGQKTFEYYGYDWRMPLWDPKMIEFWCTISNYYKNEQFLYRSTIEEYNYANVWGKGNEVNKCSISLPVLKYIRIFFKIITIVLTLGNYKAWDRIDRVLFLYFYHIPRMYCTVPYWKIVFSLFKYPRHSVAFDVKRYLARYK